MKKILLIGLLLVTVPVEAQAAKPDNKSDRFERIEMRRRIRLRRLNPTPIQAAPTKEVVAPKKTTRSRFADRRKLRSQSRTTSVANQRRRARLQLRESNKGEAEDVLLFVNQHRSAVGLPSLTLNTRLSEAAKVHAKDMNTRGYFRHKSPEGNDMEDRIRVTGYLVDSFEKCECFSWSFSVGENIALGQRTAKDTVDAWMQSEGHRRNILSINYEEMGFWRDGKYRVQTFGRMTKK